MWFIFSEATMKNRQGRMEGSEEDVFGKETAGLGSSYTCIYQLYPAAMPGFFTRCTSD